LSQLNIVKMMEKVNQTFVSVTGHSISFMDSEGRSVLPFNLSIFSEFCKYVINSEKGGPKCMECNNLAGVAEEELMPRISQCYLGLTMVTIPIVVNGKCNYSVTCGQMLMADEKNKFLAALPLKAKELELDAEKLIAYGKKVKVVNEQDVATTMMFLSLLAEYISITETQLEMGELQAKQLTDKIKLEKNLRETQFRFLQAQISPHFLFNTLNLVARVALKEKAEQTADLIYNLSDLLRRSYTTSNSSCTLGEEFHHLESYLKIQRMRYIGQLETEIWLEKAVEDTVIPVFSLQPLVENAVIHGLEPLPRKGYINVSAVRDGDEVVVKIIDNGAGMNQAKVDQILNGQVEPSRVQTSGMGIKNVKARLDLFFGNRYRFGIKSRPQQGTEVTLCLPINLGRGGQNG
jgi:two-component system LytT family sensor kinase